MDPSSFPAVVLAILGAITIMGAVLHYMFVRRLRGHHGEVWRSLEKPRFFFNTSVHATNALFRFIWKKEYHALDDPKLKKAGDVLRYATVLAFVLFVAGFILTSMRIAYH